MTAAPRFTLAELRATAPLALVTGASSGIGRALAIELAADGHDVVLVARTQERLEGLATELTNAHGVRAAVVPLDLTVATAPDALVDAMGEAASRLDVLVNNAGFGTFGPFAETPDAETTAMLQLNVTALTRLTRLFLPGMQARGSGRVLNVASTAAFQPGPLMAVYYASKAYVLSFSGALSEELRGSGVTVTALCPGPTRTEFHARADMEASGLLRAGSIMSAEKVARIGYRAARRGKRVVIPGLLNRLVAFAQRFFPRGFVARAVRWVQAPRAPAGEASPGRGSAE